MRLSLIERGQGTEGEPSGTVAGNGGGNEKRTFP